MNISKRQRKLVEAAEAEVHRETVEALQARGAYDRSLFHAFLYETRLAIVVPATTSIAWTRATAKEVVTAFHACERRVSARTAIADHSFMECLFI
jgi:hypothetical protein